MTIFDIWFFVFLALWGVSMLIEWRVRGKWKDRFAGISTLLSFLVIVAGISSMIQVSGEFYGNSDLSGSDNSGHIGRLLCPHVMAYCWE